MYIYVRCITVSVLHVYIYRCIPTDLAGTTIQAGQDLTIVDVHLTVRPTESFWTRACVAPLSSILARAAIPTWFMVRAEIQICRNVQMVKD